uniref:Virion structural protein n=1 Tax=Pseudomonas phage RVTF4 TaxID=3236931 RepID=A0AB39CDC2_9VIRU
MNLELIWENKNSIPVTTEIYRGDAPLDRENLGTPLVTLTEQETRWVDQSVDRSKLYYYVFVTITENDRNVSQNYPMRAVPRRGPGPTDVVMGDMNLGYFGTIQQSMFIGAERLAGHCGFPAVGPTYNFAGVTHWHKFIRNGKVLFVPNQVISISAITAKMIYEAGCTYGTDDNGPQVPPNCTPTPQTKRITIGPDTFRIRVARGWGDDPSIPMPGGIVATPEGKSEWSDLVYPQFIVVPPDQTLPNINTIDTVTGLGINATSGAVCQEVLTATTIMVRGSAYVLTQRQSPMYCAPKTPTDNAVAWYPVLELVED